MGSTNTTSTNAKKAQNIVTKTLPQLQQDKHLLDKSLAGDNGNDQRRIAEEITTWGALLLRKNKDYGSSVWESPILAPTCDCGTAIKVRMSDKISRLNNLLKGNDTILITDESIDDTIRDLGAYCLLYLARPKNS